MYLKQMKEYYIYVYLDNRQQGVWSFENFTFNHKPFYIGKGKNNRFKHHLQPKQLSNNSIKSNIINKIIRELNELPFHYKIIDNLTNEEAVELEIKLIKHFGRIDKNTGILANMTDGGEGFINLTITNDTKKKMSEKAKGNKTYSNNGMSKTIEQYSLNGVLLNVFSSLREAGEFINKDFKNISSCCRGKSKTAYGYVWKYIGKSYNPKIIPEIKSKRKKVYQYDLDGNFIKSYESMNIAEKETKSKHISCACLGRINFSGGFQWRYEYLEKLEPLTFSVTKNINRYKNEKKINS